MQSPGRILLLIAALLLLLLLLPVTAEGAYADSGSRLQIRYLFWRKTVFPQGKRPPKQKKAIAKKKKSKPSPLASLQEAPKKELLSQTVSALPKLWKPIQKLLRRTAVADLCVDAVIGGKDAADTAISYGKACTAIPNALALLDRTVKLTCRRCGISPDFTTETTRLRIAGRVRVIPLTVLIAALNLVIVAAVAALRLRRSAHGRTPDRKAGQADGKSASDR